MAWCRGRNSMKDDLGNIYSGEGNGGTGDSEGYNMSWSKTFEKLDKEQRS